MTKAKMPAEPRSIGETKSIDIIGIVSDLNPNNIDAAFASFGKEEEAVEEEAEKETQSEDVSETKEEKPTSDTIASNQRKETEAKRKPTEPKQDKASEEEKANDEPVVSAEGTAFSYKNIVKKSVVDNNKYKQFWLREETIDMLDAICKGCDCQVSRNAIVHNLVSAFLKENLSLLKKNYEAKSKEKKKKDYLK